MTKADSKTRQAEELGISRSSLYYKLRQPDKDWETRVMIEKGLRVHPSYGPKRMGPYLGINHKRVARVMSLHNIKPYRRRGKKQPSKATGKADFPNLLWTNQPSYPNHIWASDFTYLAFEGKFVYVATILDLYTRKI